MCDIANDTQHSIYTSSDVLLYFGKVRVDYQMSQCLSGFKRLLEERGPDSILTSGAVQTQAVSGIAGQLTSALGSVAPPDKLMDLFGTFRQASTGDQDGIERVALPMLNAFVEIFAGDQAKAFDFDHMSDSPLTTILFDLIMYNKPEIFEVALLLLTRTFSQREDLVLALESSQLLFSTKAIEAYSVLKSELDVLKNDIESYETWGVDNDFSPCCGEVHERVRAVLHRLTNLCTVGDEEDTGIPNPENQNLFRNLSVHKVVLRALELEEPNTDIDSESSQLAEIKKLAFLFFRSFVLKSEVNQQIVYSSGFRTLLKALSSQKYGIHAIIVISAVFEGNIVLASTVPESLLDRLASIIDNSHKAGRQMPGVLTLFEKLAVVDGKPIRRNQESILHVLQQPKFAGERFPTRDEWFIINARKPRLQRFRNVMNVDKTFVIFPKLAFCLTLSVILMLILFRSSYGALYASGWIR